LADWFAPKRFGIGAGKPISWQGWLLTIGYFLSDRRRRTVVSEEPACLPCSPNPGDGRLLDHFGEYRPRRVALALGKGRLAERQVVLLIEQAPLVEIGMHRSRRLLHKIPRA
jgi:hypothetical protein